MSFLRDELFRKLTEYIKVHGRDFYAVEFSLLDLAKILHVEDYVTLREILRMLGFERIHVGGEEVWRINKSGIKRLTKDMSEELYEQYSY